MLYKLLKDQLNVKNVQTYGIYFEGIHNKMLKNTFMTK